MPVAIPAIDAINGAAEAHLATPAVAAVADERLARGEAALHARKVAAAEGRLIEPDAACAEHGCARWRCDESHT